MKTLYLVRHAKSDHPQDVADFDRPLNERGHQDAPKMAKFLLENGHKIDKFISSPAKRALTTCRYFAETFGNSDIKKEEDLYEPLQEDFAKTILRISDDADSAALFSHNPSVSEYATSLAGKPLEFPTCGVAVFNVDCEEWSLFESSQITLTAFFAPKDIS